jgi:hypothetical protein
MATKGIGRPLTILLRADNTQLARGLQKAESQLQAFGKKTEAAARVATVALAGIGAAAFSVTQSASDLNESISKSNVIFGDSAQAIQNWAKTTDQALGLSQVAALEAAGNFAILGQSAGLTGTDLTVFSKDLTTLAADLASFNNTSVDEAITALAAGLRGESEPLRRFGVLLSEAEVQAKALEMGLAGSIKEITNQDKVLARNALILEQTTIQQGDFARTSEGAANQQRILAAEIENTKAQLGEGLLPAYQDLLKALIPAVEYLAENSEQVVQLGKFVAIASAGVIGLNTAVKLTSISIAVLTPILAGLRLGYITLAAATGSAAAAQALAELTYKNSRIAAILYTIALAAQNVVTIALTGGIKALTIALLSNPFTAVAAAAAILVGVLYKLYQNTKAVREENEALASAIKATRKDDKEDVLSAKRHVRARIGMTKATNDLTVATVNYGGASAKSTKAADKAAEKLRKQQEALAATKKAFADYASGVKNALAAQFSFQSAFEAKGKGSFLEALKKQAAAAIAFSGKIAKLVALGLSRGGLDQVLAAGPQVGGQIADELLAGGTGAVRDVNALVASVNAVTGQTGAAVSSALGGKTGSGNINITINGAIDPEGVRRSLEKLFQQSGARIGAVSLASSSL